MGKKNQSGAIPADPTKRDATVKARFALEVTFIVILLTYAFILAQTWLGKIKHFQEAHKMHGGFAMNFGEREPFLG